MNRAYPWRVKNKEETFCIEELGATWGAVQVPGKTSLHYVCTSESDRKNGDDFVTTREFVSNRIDEGDRFQVENSQRETFESIIGSQFDNGCGDCLQIQSLDNGQLHREENSPQIDNETKFANPKTSKAIEEGTTLGNHSESFVSDKCSTSFNFPLVVSSSPCGFIKDSGKGHQVVSEILHDNCQNSLSRIEGFGERRSITLPLDCRRLSFEHDSISSHCCKVETSQANLLLDEVHAFEDVALNGNSLRISFSEKGCCNLLGIKRSQFEFDSKNSRTQECECHSTIHPTTLETTRSSKDDQVDSVFGHLKPIEDMSFTRVLPLEAKLVPHYPCPALKETGPLLHGWNRDLKNWHSELERFGSPLTWDNFFPFVPTLDRLWNLTGSSLNSSINTLPT